MKQHPAERGRVFVARVHWFCLVLALVTAALSGWWGLKASLAALIGGVAVVLPQMYAAKRLLQPFGAGQATRFYVALWVFQGLKWLFTMALLVAAYLMLKGFEEFTLLGFLITFQGLWLVPLFLQRKG